MSTEQWKIDNRDKMCEYRRKWYKDNAERAKARVFERRRELRKWLWEKKSELACKKCGEDETVCLDFHHKDAKKKEVSLGVAISRGFSRERIMKEIAKCTILCSNCHRKLHGGVV